MKVSDIGITLIIKTMASWRPAPVDTALRNGVKSTLHDKMNLFSSNL